MQVFKKESMLTVDQFARAIGMSRRHVYDLVDRGQQDGGVLAFRFGGRRGIRIPGEEVSRIKEQRRIDVGL